MHVVRFSFITFNYVIVVMSKIIVIGTCYVFCPMCHNLQIDYEMSCPKTGYTHILDKSKHPNPPESFNAVEKFFFLSALENMTAVPL